MASKSSISGKRPVKKGGKFFPALCNIIGTLILLAVILVSLPLAFPRFLGYETFTVVSGSMEPAIPEGSIVYVEPVEPRDVEEGDIIAFNSNGTVVTHRVMRNQYFYEEFVTKGDANAEEDINPVEYQDLIGRVKYHIPIIGRFLMLYANNVGKIYLLSFAACGVMFNMLAGRMRRRSEEKFQKALYRWERQQALRIKRETEKTLSGK